MPARSRALSGVNCNKYRSAIKPGVVPYAAKLYAYIFVANVLAVVIAMG